MFEKTEGHSMKIAICIPRSTIGGVSTSTYILASGLRERGYQADIVITGKHVGPDYQRALDDGWPVHSICAGELWLRDRIARVLAYLSSYDVVINNHSLETRLVMPALDASVSRISVIRSTDHRVIHEARYGADYLDAMVGISPAVSAALKEQISDCPVYTIPNAVLVENDSLPSLSFPLRIIYVGRLESRQKDILLLPDIAEQMRERDMSFRLDIVGDGPDRAKLERTIHRKGLTDLITMHGALHRFDAWHLLSQSHFSLIPSRFEGFGLVLAESMAAGAIPVVHDIPVFRWILGNDASRLAVGGHCSARYAEIIKTIANDTDLYQTLQRRLQLRQKKNFFPSATVSAYEKLIQQVVDEPMRKSTSVVMLKDLPLPVLTRIRCTRPWYQLQKLNQRVKERF